MVLIKKPEYGKRKNLIIIGAGEAGNLIGKHILENPNLNYNILAFVDDDEKKIGKFLFDLPIFGPTEKIREIIKEKNPDEILIAIPSAPGEVIRKFMRNLSITKINIKILPGSFETPYFFTKKEADIEPIRDLKVEDFFRRKPVISDFKKIIDFFSEKVVLVTGAAGSIGSELCRQLLNLNISKLIALDNRETALHELVLELNENFKDKVFPVIADIRDREKIGKILEKNKPSIIFHAAAYKHVPMMELNPEEAIKTNIFGTKNLIELTENIGVENFVLISTDKSVNPKSIMGATKSIAEKIMQFNSKNKNINPKFIAVRFGNVLNSDGSAVPLFERQIEKGGPVTITHPEMKRFFMTIPEAVQLVIQSTFLGDSGDIFILDMGEEYKILDLACDMIRLRGLEPDKDVKIEIIGLRAGEKLFEELINSHELKEETENKRIFLIKNSKNNCFDKEKFLYDLEELKLLSEKMDKPKITLKLKEIIPTFCA